MYPKMPITKKVNIDSLHTIFTDTRDVNYKFEGERHDFWEVVCVLKGNVGVVSDNDLYTLHEGQTVFHKPMEFHNIWSENAENTVFIFSFNGKMPSLNHKVYNFGPKEESIIDEVINVVPNVFEFDVLNITKIKDGMDFEAERIVKMLELLIISLINNVKGNVSDISTKSAQNYLTIISAMNQNIDRNLSLPEIAKICNMSISGIKKTFKKYSGMSVMKYFNDLRIKKAQKLLKSTRLPINEIALKCGIPDYNYFSKVFKKEVGISPREYR
ncbi:MAG: AraC family transcriptional regulator, partial [Clostridia bacterium]|nr:AraC family transcriptional regulator [Clostridia bacterium]